MNNKQIEFVKRCISEDDVHRFYCTKEWKRIRKKVMGLDHNECQKCRHVYHRVRKAALVHHINHLRDYPHLALEIYDEHGKRNLVSLCKSCHEEEHPEERNKYHKKSDKFVNEERW